MTIKPPSGIPPSVAPATIPAATGSVSSPQTSQASAPAATPINPEAVAKAVQEYQKLREKLKQPALSGAAGLFIDNLVFPVDLLDPNNPANDPKYFHLLCSLFGLKELKKYFETSDQYGEEEENQEQASPEKDSDAS